ncbi:major facilitator superfamily domain-containing protein [Mycena olivaceomarginata]|nr:major facilitator superfamily domain-containing protein [Mycena olivaceomarginata]
MIAPASPQVAAHFGITNDVVIGLITSIFVLAYVACQPSAPLFLGPLSEIFGRNRVIQGANLWYLVWNIGCGFAQNTGELLAFRFLSGLGGSAPLAIGGGVLGDIWDAEERGQALAIYSLAPLLGPVVGPLCGAFIAEKSTWRWVFWSTSIVDVGIQILGILYLRESYAPFILEQKANQIRASLPTEGPGPARHVRSKFASEDRTWQQIMKIALTRPFVLFINEPIVQYSGSTWRSYTGSFIVRPPLPSLTPPPDAETESEGSDVDVESDITHDFLTSLTLHTHPASPVPLPLLLRFLTLASLASLTLPPLGPADVRAFAAFALRSRLSHTLRELTLALARSLAARYSTSSLRC